MSLLVIIKTKYFFLLVELVHTYLPVDSFHHLENSVLKDIEVKS